MGKRRRFREAQQKRIADGEIVFDPVRGYIPAPLWKPSTPESEAAEAEDRAAIKNALSGVPHEPECRCFGCLSANFMMCEDGKIRKRPDAVP
jgi:hypothetical protein